MSQNIFLPIFTNQLGTWPDAFLVPECWIDLAPNVMQVNCTPLHNAQLHAALKKCVRLCMGYLSCISSEVSIIAHIMHIGNQKFYH